MSVLIWEHCRANLFNPSVAKNYFWLSQILACRVRTGSKSRNLRNDLFYMLIWNLQGKMEERKECRSGWLHKGLILTTQINIFLPLPQASSHLTPIKPPPNTCQQVLKNHTVLIYRNKNSIGTCHIQSSINGRKTRRRPDNITRLVANNTA